MVCVLTTGPRRSQLPKAQAKFSCSATSGHGAVR
jgi:hypothetical protein